MRLASRLRHFAGQYGARSPLDLAWEVNVGQENLCALAFAGKLASGLWYFCIAWIDFVFFLTVNRWLLDRCTATISNYHAPNDMTSSFFFSFKEDHEKYHEISPTVAHWFSAPCLHWAHWRGRIRSAEMKYKCSNDIPKVICRTDETGKWARCGTGRGFQFPVAILAHFRQFSIKLRFLTSFQMTSWNNVRNREMTWNLTPDSWTVRWEWIWSWCPASLEHGNSGLRICGL